MGYTKFTSYENILNYDYKSKADINEALGALDAMYKAKNITKYQYDNACALLTSKLKSL